MLKNFAQNWLDIQCQSIAGFRCALFLLYDPEKHTLNPVAQRPVDTKEPLELLAIAQVVAKSHEPVINAGVSGMEKEIADFDYFGLPIVVDKSLLGVLAVKTHHQPEFQQQRILDILRAGSKWLALPQPEQESFYLTVVKLAVGCLEQDSLAKICNILISSLSQEFGCDRVAISMVSGSNARIIALSNSAHFDDKSNLLRMLTAAMEEAIDQEQVIVFPPPTQVNPLIIHAHADLAIKFGCHAICTIPVVHEDRIFAVVTMERNDQVLFDEKTMAICEQTLALVAPFLHLKQLHELPPVKKLQLWLKNSLEGIISFEHSSIKLAFALLGLFLLATALISGDFRVHADAVLEGRIQRTVSAPMDGFIKLANSRAGDTVTKDQVMATMEDGNLKLELVKLSGQEQQLQREYREALANRDLVQIRVLNSQLEQVGAQVTLKQEQLKRTIIRAPFDGIVLEGDLSQSLGAPVDRGDSLFKIAPLDGYRVILKVNERDISHVRAGQPGVIKLSSLPDKELPLNVEKITQVATAEYNRNIFRVEANLLDRPALLRPGMEGIGKIEVGRKKLLWIWTHELNRWLKLWLWSWWP